MKVKVREATGRVLDYLVAKALGGEGFYFDTVATYWIKIDGKDRALSNGWGSMSFTPSSDPAHAWPIIDSKGIWLRKMGAEWEGLSGWFPQAIITAGPNSLIAAMRCFVVSELGEEVEVPDALA